MSLPNFNPANQGSLSGVLKEVLKNYGLQFECSIPAVVVSYDRSNNVVVVRPAINIESTDGSIIQRDTIELPVHCQCGGGIISSFPLNEGDTGWIIAGDRDIALFKQSLAVANPNTRRQHRYSFGFFLPDKVSKIAISQSDNGKFVLQTLDGKTKVTLADGEVNVITDGSLTANAQSATITASSVVINGNVTVNGTITATGATIGGIVMQTHIHTSGGAGSDSSGPKNA